MGNQNTKVNFKNVKQAVTRDDEGLQKSRTHWKAGVPAAPGQPVIELSSKVTNPRIESVTDEVNLSWEIPEDDGGFPLTGYRVEMLDIKSGRWIEITFVEGYVPRCALSNILYGIMYRFRVVALNDAGFSEPSEPSEPVVIDVPGVQIAPYFVTGINDVVVLEHEKIEFRVRALGTPKPSVQWYKDDVEIFACERIEIREEVEGGAVVLKAAMLNDAGAVKCVAANVLGRATSVAQLMVEAAPRFEVPESYVDGLIYRQEELIRLKLPLFAKPEAKIVWFFEDEPISPGSDLQIETTNTYTYLKIDCAKRWHCGEYKVHAQNENGEDNASVLVTVISSPLPPGRPIVIDISETKCTLRWQPSEDDGGADVKHYIVEYFRDVWDVWLKAKTTKEHQAIIDALIPGSRYKFRIKAENAYGISEPGDESDPFDVAGAAIERQQLSSSPGKPPIINVTVSPPSPPDNVSSTHPNLNSSRKMWDSEDGEEDILDRFLKAAQFTGNQQPSFDSDGLPSMTAIEDERECLLEARDSSRRNQRLFKETINRSEMESVCSYDEGVLNSVVDLQVPETSSKGEMHEERSIVEISADTIATSTESLSSIIPVQKRQELSRFEISLRDMIKEAKQLTEADALPLASDGRSEWAGSSASTLHWQCEEPLSSLPSISITAHEVLPKKPPPRGVAKSHPVSPAVGADRYEEIISTRGRRGSSQLNNMLSSTGTVQTLTDREAKFSTSPDKTAGAERVDEISTTIYGGPSDGHGASKSNIPTLMNLAPPKFQTQLKPFVPKPIELTADPLSNVARNRTEVNPDSGYQWRKLPDWLLLSTTYSVIFITILTIGNNTPQGGLYINFTALCSMMLYFFCQDTAFSFQLS